MNHRIAWALIAIALLIGAVPMIIAFIVGAGVAASIIGYRWGVRAVMGERAVFVEDEDE